jgi:hypothetical protein
MWERCRFITVSLREFKVQQGRDKDFHISGIDTASNMCRNDLFSICLGQEFLLDEVGPL